MAVPVITSINGRLSGANKGQIGELVNIGGTNFLDGSPCAEIPNNKVSNGSFCTDLTGWTTATLNGGALSAVQNLENAEISITNLGATGDRTNCRFEQFNTGMQQFNNYILQVTALSDITNKSLRVAILDMNDFLQPIHIFDFSLTTGFIIYATPLFAIAAQTNIAVSFQMGGNTNPGDVTFDQVNLQEIP